MQDWKTRHEAVVASGGLHIIGTERHDSRRIDNQLRGRAGRQGDPGSSRFYLSLEDDLMKRFASDRVAGIMERLGLEEDMAIESRLVSRTIESAQTRVEGYNFDMRKHVVEYDDVISRQRETVYEERDKVLRNESLDETVESFVDSEIDALVDRHLPPSANKRDWGMAALLAAVEAMGLGSADLTEDSLWDLGGGEAVAERLKDLAAERMAARDADNHDEWALLMRLVLLRTIDTVWIEHLTEIDDMRKGIGLRGIAQEDPLNAFKKEAFAMYGEMQGIIAHQVATTIFRVSIVRQPAVQAGVEGTGAGTPPDDAAAQRIARGMSHLRKPLPAGRESGGGPAAEGGELCPGYSPAGVKMGRNDACWCGSGAKYKKCHGR